jgi:DNA-binding transcriptional regulator of glucitol operon
VHRRFLKPGWFIGHFLVLVAVLVCLRLGLWQWHRTHEATGTIQNLGYTILWPVFGGAFIYMWIRFLQLEVLKDAEDDAELTAMAAGQTIGADDLSDPAGERGTQVRAFESDPLPQADLTSTAVLSEAPGIEQVADEKMKADHRSTTRGPRVSPSQAYTVAVATVGDENEDQDPELATYNRALAALAEKDRRRAR